jgi:outer membrane protein OmpA-like peptidoglycan-associated protein
MRQKALTVCAALSMFTAGCATKGYVREQIQATDAKLTRQVEAQDTRLRETADGVAASRQALDATDQRLDQRLDDVNARVGTLDTAASNAQNRAEQASNDTRNAEARLSQRISDRNKYRLLETRVVYFEPDRTEIRAVGVSELDDVARLLQADPNALVELQGFADPRGTDRHNDELARERVEAVARYLVRHGIDLRQIRTIGMGKVDVTPGGSLNSDALANARRVEVRLLAPWSSWEDNSSPAASPREPDLADPRTDQGPRDDAEFTPERAGSVLRLLENRGQVPRESSTYP